ncbi:hypothetical protein [Williamwhitmania taraxaci]|uniref:Lipoprotein n=1 Tax=Williamwhitmania taraxaci TaxID=1640674 RepID=A0A1G6I4P7_9BACT|nr:hypothetical protein [Williamwhitmania taraxaci]SDC01539.1 hypothetical protein SAMN05216323_101460 [Williamwhitmania taraxaci]
MNRLILIMMVPFIMSSCKKWNEDSTETFCYSCENEKTIDTCYNVHAKVVDFWHDPIHGQETTTGFTIRQEDLTTPGTYVIEADSCLIPCPPLQGEFKQLDTHVLISYCLKNCKPYLSSPNQRGLIYGRKIEILSIKHY